MCKAVSGAVVVICNLLFIPIGLALIIFGALIKWNPQLLVDKILPTIISETTDDDGKKWANTLVTDIVAALGDYGLVIFLFGIFLFLLSFCAVCGVCCKSKILLGTYAACLILIFLALLIFTIVFGVRTSWFKERSEMALKEMIVRRYIMNNEQPIRTGLSGWINEMQIRRYCCGSSGYHDFELNDSFKRQQYKLPSTCCRDQRDTECWKKPDGRNSYMNRGCNEYIWEVLSKHIHYVLYALIGLLIVTFLFAVLAIYLLTVYSRTELRAV